MQLCLMLRGEGFKGNENQIGRVSGQVGLPKFTNTYHLNRKQNGNILAGWTFPYIQEDAAEQLVL